MAVIVPFQGIRPAAAYVQRVAALPYDVYNREEAAGEAAKDRLSFLNIDRPETQFDPAQDMYAPEVYQKAAQMLEQEIKDGIFIQDAEKQYYLYELTMNGRSQTGLVACASIDDYLGNVIKKHENTRAEKEEDRVRHVDVCNMQTGPIFLAYRKNQLIQSITESVKKSTPVFDFVSGDGIGHRGWCIREKRDINSIQKAFAEIGEIYIADGHHRAASAVRVGQMRRAEHADYTGTEEFNYFLSVLFPDDELLIMDYNRAVKDLNGYTKQEFLQKLQNIFTIERLEVGTGTVPVKPQKKGELLLCLPETWYRLQIRPEYQKEDPVEGLDVSILQNEFLEPVLGIQDPKTDKRIDFIGGIRGLEELARRVHTDCAAAFAMYPTSIWELFSVADAGQLMPPKSTWFEPKLRSGLFLHKIF